MSEKLTAMKNANVIIGVTGSIAAYKACDIVSKLTQLEVNVKVVMTKSAQEFVSPLTFKTLSRDTVITDMFNAFSPVPHIDLSSWADVLLIAPATANIIGKIANGIADDMLSTLVMSIEAPVILAPAMNTKMMENPRYRKNAGVLSESGMRFVETEEGYLACGCEGKGRMASTETILEALDQVLRNRDKQP